MKFTQTTVESALERERMMIRQQEKKAMASLPRIDKNNALKSGMLGLSPL